LRNPKTGYEFLSMEEKLEAYKELKRRVDEYLGKIKVDDL